MNCLCGHPQWEHVLGGRCRVLDCPCERFEPGDTLGLGGAPRVLGWLVIVLTALHGVALGADGPAPPPSFARPAAAARLATIVLRAPVDEYDIWAPAPEEASPDVTLGEEELRAFESLAERELRTLASELRTNVG